MNIQGCIYPFLAIFAIAGLACGVFGVSNLISRHQIKREGVQTTGTVVAQDTSFEGISPVVSFQDEQGNEILYCHNYRTDQSEYQLGQSIKLWYLPSNPKSEIVLDETVWEAFFPFIFLISHGGVGIGGLIWFERKRRLRKWLLNQGQEVMATFKTVETTHNKGTFYTPVFEWNDPYTNVLYMFKGDSDRKDPTTFITLGSPVQVLIDPQNPKRYLVDQSFMKG